MNKNPVSGIPSRQLFGLNIMAVHYDEAVTLLSEAARIKSPGKAQVVVTPNVDHIVKLDKNKSFQPDYAQADFIFADGMPVIWASRLLAQPLPQRITGADLFVSMCREAIQHQWKVVLIGGRPGSESSLKARFDSHLPGLDLHIIAPSMRFDPLGNEGRIIADQVRELAPQLVFVCLGFPKQERWALHYAASFPQGLLMCVGAAMEFAIGLQARAPLWMQRTGLEWLWRLLSNPGHLWRRYLVEDPYFFMLCLREWKHNRRRNKIQ